MSPKKIRTNLQPWLMLSFIVVAITGVLMMFHINAGGLKNLHEWLGVVFLVLCLVHLYLNWKVFKVHFQNGPALLSIIGIGALSALLLLTAGGNGKNGGHGWAGSGQYNHVGDRHYR